MPLTPLAAPPRTVTLPLDLAARSRPPLHHVIVLATYFGIGAPVTWIFSLAIAVGGAFWAWLYHRSGSLVGPWLSHVLGAAAMFWMGSEIFQKMIAHLLGRPRYCTEGLRGPRG